MGVANGYRVKADGTLQCLKCFGQVVNGQCKSCRTQYSTKDELKLTGQKNAAYAAEAILDAVHRGKKKAKLK